MQVQESPYSPLYSMDTGIGLRLEEEFAFLGDFEQRTFLPTSSIMAIPLLFLSYGQANYQSPFQFETQGQTGMGFSSILSNIPLSLFAKLSVIFLRLRGIVPPSDRAWDTRFFFCLTFLAPFRGATYKFCYPQQLNNQAQLFCSPPLLLLLTPYLDPEWLRFALSDSRLFGFREDLCVECSKLIYATLKGRDKWQGCREERRESLSIFSLQYLKTYRREQAKLETGSQVE